jgi:hypothetical protein
MSCSVIRVCNIEYVSRRAGLILAAIPILLSIVVLRVVAFQRERKRKKPVPTAGVV